MVPSWSHHWWYADLFLLLKLIYGFTKSIRSLSCMFLKYLGTIYPGLMLTSAVLYHVMNFLHISIDVRNVCVFLAPLFSSLTTIVTFLLTKELKVSLD